VDCKAAEVEAMVFVVSSDVTAAIVSYVIFTCKRFENVLLSAEIGSPIIVTIWNDVFANKSRKLGRISIKLGRWGYA